MTTFDRETLCAIIETCSKSGVRDFSYLGLELKFKDIHSPDPAPVFVPEEVRKIQDSQTRSFINSQELTAKQDQLDQMLIEDPQGYEAFLRSGDAVERT